MAAQHTKQHNEDTNRDHTALSMIFINDDNNDDDKTKNNNYNNKNAY